MANELLIRINSELDDQGLKDLEAGIQEAGGSLSDMGSEGEKAGSEVAEGAGKGAEGIDGMNKNAGMFILKAATIIASIKKMYDATKTQVMAELQLKAAIKDTTTVSDRMGDSVDAVYKKYVAFAQERQRSVGIGDEETLAAIAQFQLMGVAVEDMVRFTETAQNMAVGTGRALEGVGRQLVRVYADPLANMKLLERQGIFLNETTLESMSLSEQQAYLMDELNGRFKSQAEAVNAANYGLQDFQNAIGDAFEEVGKMVLPILRAFLEPLTNLITFLNNAPPLLKGFGIALSALIPIFLMAAGPLSVILAGIALVVGAMAIFDPGAEKNVKDMIDSLAEAGEQFDYLRTKMQEVSEQNIASDKQLEQLSQLKEGSEEYKDALADLIKNNEELLGKNITLASSYADVKTAMLAVNDSRTQNAQRAAAVQTTATQINIAAAFQKSMALMAEARRDYNVMEIVNMKAAGQTEAQYRAAQIEAARTVVDQTRGAFNEVIKFGLESGRTVASISSEYAVMYGEIKKQQELVALREQQNHEKALALSSGASGQELLQMTVRHSTEAGRLSAANYTAEFRSVVQSQADILSRGTPQVVEAAAETGADAGAAAGAAFQEAAEPTAEELAKQLREKQFESIEKVGGYYQDVMTMANGDVLGGLSSLANKAAQVFDSVGMGWVGFGITAVKGLFQLFADESQIGVSNFQKMLNEMEIQVNISQSKANIAESIFGEDSTAALQAGMKTTQTQIDGYRKALEKAFFKSGLSDLEVLQIIAALQSGDLESIKQFIPAPEDGYNAWSYALGISNYSEYTDFVLEQFTDDMEEALAIADETAAAFAERYEYQMQLAAKGAIDALKEIDFQEAMGYITEEEANKKRIAAYDDMIESWENLLENMGTGEEYSGIRETLEWAIKDALVEQYKIQQDITGEMKEQNDLAEGYANKNEKLAALLEQKKSLEMDLEAGRRIADRETLTLMTDVDMAIIDVLNQMGAGREVIHQYEVDIKDRAEQTFGAGIVGAGIGAGYDPYQLFNQNSSNSNTVYQGDIYIDGQALGVAGSGFNEALRKLISETGGIGYA